VAATENERMRKEGKITTWNDNRGFGFISPRNGGKRVFVHIKAFGNQTGRPEVNQTVSYEMSQDHKGRPCAAQVTLEGSSPTPSLPLGRRALSIIGAVVFLLGVGIAALFVPAQSRLLLYTISISVVTFIVYGVDKWAAMRNQWRIPENTLHLLSLAGGWPGALIAQQILRHKSRKPSFQAVFWITVALNGAATVFLFTPHGAETLQSWLKELTSDIR